VARVCADSSDLILRRAPERVSKDGRESVRCLHPSRRGQEAAPQDEVCVVEKVKTKKHD
jgi:hypothetical protein